MSKIYYHSQKPIFSQKHPVNPLIGGYPDSDKKYPENPQSKLIYWIP
jgi:hypothetical protein